MIASTGFYQGAGTSTCVYELYATDTHEGYGYHNIDLDYAVLNVWPWKEYFWRWLRSYHSEILIVLRNFKTVILWNKRYINRMMFCKSGYLGKRIRKIRKSK